MKRKSIHRTRHFGRRPCRQNSVEVEMAGMELGLLSLIGHIAGLEQKLAEACNDGLRPLDVEIHTTTILPTCPLAEANEANLQAAVQDSFYLGRGFGNAEGKDIGIHAALCAVQAEANRRKLDLDEILAQAITNLMNDGYRAPEPDTCAVADGVSRALAALDEVLGESNLSANQINFIKHQVLLRSFTQDADNLVGNA